MKTTLCTLYNSLYLDKGLVLYDSLKACAKDFELYVLCMDDKTFDVLSDFNEERLKPIRLSDVENDKMLEAKSNRSVAEYCWTCSSRLIQYIFEAFQCDCCTYIDADMYFYHDPQILVEEMLDSGASVMMVPHRFTERNKHLAEKVGTYCVEFNCFKNDAAGLEILNHWYGKCLDCCSNLNDGIHFGDQKYMDEWPKLFPDKVHVCEHAGAGLAPWNIEWYQGYRPDNTVLCRMTGNRVPIIFYHFQSLSYIRRKLIDISIEKNCFIEKELVEAIYIPYLERIESCKTYLVCKSGLNILVRSHPSAKRSRLKYFLERCRVIQYLYKKLNKDTRYIIELD